MAKKDYTLKQFYDNKIIGAVNRLIGNSVSKTLTNINKRVLKFHTKMFSYLASQAGVINSGAAPEFMGLTGMSQPKYNQLGALKKYRNKGEKKSRKYNYLKRKQTLLKTLVGGFSYYLYSGYLQKYLNNTDPTTTFGKPQILYNRKGAKGSMRQTFTNVSKKGPKYIDEFIDSKSTEMKPSDFKPLKNLGEFQVDLYPKITKITKSMSFQDIFPDKVAYRLDNYRGGKNRQFMPQYMKWWAEVKLKNLLKENK
jgi:hypothetical protein